MNISQWPIGRIMQLPCHCFGARWLVGLGVQLVDGGPLFGISEAALPERGVIWAVHFSVMGSFGGSIEFAFVLGDQLPADDAMFDAGELLFSGVMSGGGRRSAFDVVTTASTRVQSFAAPFQASGRRLIMRCIRSATAGKECQAVFAISSMPKEVPDWLISGLDKSRL